MKSRKIIAGVDEVGRGSLIGSVYSAAVVLPVNGFSLELKDSKKLGEKSRIKIANSLIKESVCISIGIATNCLLYTSPSPRDKRQSRMPSSA